MIVKYNEDGTPNIWAVKQTELTDECVEKIVDEVVKGLNDKEQIVRCKDCKYISTEGKTTRYNYCNLYKYPIDLTDFCSRGERRCEKDG